MWFTSGLDDWIPALPLAILANQPLERCLLAKCSPTILVRNPIRIGYPARKSQLITSFIELFHHPTLMTEFIEPVVYRLSGAAVWAGGQDLSLSRRHSEDRLHPGRAAGSEADRSMEGRQRYRRLRGAAGRGSDGDWVRPQHAFLGR